MDLQLSSISTKPLRHCNFYLIRKKRYCRMIPKEPEDYCCEHLSNKPMDSDRMRIPCPLDKKHSCYADKLNKHLKICNAKPKNECFIVEGINSGYISENIGVTEEKIISSPLSSRSSIEILQVIDKIEKIYESLKIIIDPKISKHEILEEEMKNPIYGDRKKKHLIQVSSILGILSEYNLLKKNTCLIEFGAGRGALSYWISEAVPEEISIILVEKASPKHKKDNKLNKSFQKIQRIRVGIEDLVLDEIDTINNSEYLVGISKHLCGAATDFALRCLINTLKNKHKLMGFIMTFCCHHRCTWSSFVGRKYFEKFDLSENDFELLCGLVSWATCGSGLSRERRKTSDSVHSDQKLGLSSSRKQEIGHKCKNLINWGRQQFIKDEGFDCSLNYYVDSSITPENVCIICKK